MTDNTTNKYTSADGLARAHAAFHGNWDSAGVTMVFLPKAIAEKMLADHGWTRDPWRGGPGPWRSPSGDHIWETDEAVALAITAEALTDAPTADGPASDEQRLRDLVTTVLEHDPPQDETDEIVIERIAPATSGLSLIVAASDRRLIVASLAGAPTQLWHQLADRVIDAIDAPDSSTNNSTRPDGR